eukprot:6564984-Pyramimonas_sp.AAC.1
MALASSNCCIGCNLGDATWRAGASVGWGPPEGLQQGAESNDCGRRRRMGRKRRRRQRRRRGGMPSCGVGPSF